MRAAHVLTTSSFETHRTLGSDDCAMLLRMRWSQTVDSASEYPASDGIELLQQRLVAEFGRGDQRRIERPVAAYRARFVLARKIGRETGNEPLGLVGIGRKHLDHVR